MLIDILLLEVKGVAIKIEDHFVVIIDHKKVEEIISIVIIIAVMSKESVPQIGEKDS